MGSPRPDRCQPLRHPASRRFHRQRRPQLRLRPLAQRRGEVLILPDPPHALRRMRFRGIGPARTAVVGRDGLVDLDQRLVDQQAVAFIHDVQIAGIARADHRPGQQHRRRHGQANSLAAVQGDVAVADIHQRDGLVHAEDAVDDHDPVARRRMQSGDQRRMLLPERGLQDQQDRLGRRIAYGDGRVEQRVERLRRQVGETPRASAMFCSSPRHSTASSMNFERSPFFRPRRARKLRTAMAVCLETGTVQRVVSFGQRLWVGAYPPTPSCGNQA